MKLKDWTVDVIGKRYKIKWGGVSGKDYGECLPAKCEIRVDPKSAEEQQKDTLLHECLHAIDHEMNTRMNERQVRLTATALLHYMRSNPEIVRWLISR